MQPVKIGRIRAHRYEGNLGVCFDKTRPERIINDLQTFSNIEEDNLPCAIAVLGYTRLVGNVTLFAGIRNLNEDYFTTPCMSLFTNSSCGIFPTLSANYPIANYPLAALCLDYKMTLGRFGIECERME